MKIYTIKLEGAQTGISILPEFPSLLPIYLDSLFFIFS
nr:MAG TPA: Stage V sporulation protein family [Caudoviricetes sp.]